MTRKRRERSLKELYDVTEMIQSAKITPVLEGSCHIQGPVDEIENELQESNCSTPPVEKGYMIVNQTTRAGAESGTCNVCSAPCSSCMHINRTSSVMEPNVEGAYSINKLGRDEADCCSFNGSEVLPLYKSRACDEPQHAASETSNLLSVSSSHDSYSENAESKATLMGHTTNDASEDVDMHPELSVEAVGQGGHLPKETNISSDDLLSSKSHLISIPQQRPYQSQKEEQHHLECHGDNISCVTEGIDATIAVNVCNMDAGGKEAVINVASIKSEVAKGIESKSQVEAGNLCQDSEIRECEIRSQEPNACSKDLVQKMGSGSSSVNTDCSNKPDNVDHYSLKMKSSKDETSDYLMENKELSNGVPTAFDSVEGQKTISPDHGDRKSCQLKSASASGSQKSNYPSLETDVCKENGATVEGCEVVKCSTIKELSGMSNASMDNSKILGLEKQSQLTSEGENSESDIEDDVKVCDICGDAGREECLAICSRCSDGAEHTYCMRIMMEKIPEGDWVCEECKLKEDAENDEVDGTEVILGKLKVQSLKENVMSSETASRVDGTEVLPRLDKEVNDQEAKGVIKGIQSEHISANWPSDNVEVSSVTGKRSSESNGSSIETFSPRKKVALSRENSLKKLDLPKVKPANIKQSPGNHSTNSPQALVRAQTSGSYPSKVQTSVQTPRGSLSRSTSFNSSGMKGKVKKLIENIPHKPKVTKEFASKDTRKDGPVKTTTKSASFKTVGSNRLNVESAIKTQFLNSPRSEDSKGFKHPKDRNSMDKKISFKLEHTQVSPSTMSNVIQSKADLKGSQINGKSNNVSEPNIVGVNKRSEDANDLAQSEVKKQSLNTPKTFGNSSLNSVFNYEGQKSYSISSREGIRSSTAKSCTQPEAILQREDKSKEFSSLRQVGPGSGRVLRCQRCNETGHATQFCSIDKLRVSALKPSAERLLKEGTVKSDKWKDAVEAVFSKTKMLKDGRSLDQAESTTVTTRLNPEVGPKDLPASSSNSSLGAVIYRQEVFKSSAAGPGLTGAANGVKQQDMNQLEACLPGDRQFKAMPTTLEELTSMPSVPMMTDLCSEKKSQLRVSVFPELDFIWQGDFEVLRTGRPFEPCDGVQAHLSTCASPKVLEVMKKFPGKVKLEEVPRSSAWPLQFQRIGPKEDDIALFLFAKDIESYKKNYKKLLENMLKNDLALKGFVDEVELLIFPSDKLPEIAQRWNSLFFLWAVFRERRVDCSEALPSPQKSCKSSLKVEPLVQDSLSQLASATSLKINHHESSEKDLSKSESLPKPKVSSETMGQLHGQIDPHPDSGYQITTSQLCSEQKSDITYPKILASIQVGRGADRPNNKVFGSNIVDGIGAEPSNDVQNSLNKHGALPVLPIPAVSTAGRDGGEHRASQEKPLEKEISVLGNDPHDFLTATDHLSCELKPSRKRTSSCSIVTTSLASGETLKGVDETMAGKENVNHGEENSEKEHKKTKLCGNDGFVDFPKEQQYRVSIHDEPKVQAESSRSAERYFLPFDLNSISCDEIEAEPETERVIHVLSSDDEDVQEMVTPDLELVLGGKKKPMKQETPPLFFPIVNSKSNQHQRLAGREDDSAASLSLSLAFPKLEKEQTTDDIQKTQQVLPEKAHSGSSLLLFGAFN